jgi:hypothetical protein
VKETATYDNFDLAKDVYTSMGCESAAEENRRGINAVRRHVCGDGAVDFNVAHVSALHACEVATIDAKVRLDEPSFHVNAVVAETSTPHMQREEKDGWSFSIDLLLNQKEDSQLEELRTYLETRTLPERLETEQQREHFRTAVLAYYIRPSDKVLCRLWRSSRGRARAAVFHQVVVPKSLCRHVCQAYHESEFGAHVGFARVYERVLRKYYWPTMYEDIKNYVESCSICQRKRNPPRSRSRYYDRKPVWKPFQRVSMDYMDMGAKATESGNRQLLVAIDHLTNWVEAFPCTNTDSKTAMDAIMFLSTRYGVPGEIITDNGPGFIADAVKELASTLGAVKCESEAHYHQSAGRVERANQTFQSMLRHAVTDQGDWDKHVDAVRFAYNTSFVTTTGECPFFLLYGTDPHLPIDYIVGTNEDEYANLGEYTQRLVTRLRSAWAAAATAQQETRQRLKEANIAPHRKVARQFGLLDRVYVYSPTNKTGISRKLVSHWSGPYRIIAIENPSVYRLQPADGRQIRDIRVHVSRLRPYTPRFAHLADNARHYPHQFTDDLTESVPDKLPSITRFEQESARRDPTAEEMSLLGKFFQNPKTKKCYRIVGVSWCLRHGCIVAYVKEIKKTKGTFKELQKRSHQLDQVAIDNALEWVTKSKNMFAALESNGTPTVSAIFGLDLV